ncbi:MAG: hypothetical protein JXA82_05300 [Sedimentisphaerales bacterium]|nr:hypothetical protein [Sedimentisphaerales bacterium]
MITNQFTRTRLWLEIEVWLVMVSLLIADGCGKHPGTPGIEVLLKDPNSITALVIRRSRNVNDSRVIGSPQAFGTQLVHAIEGHMTSHKLYVVANAECYAELELTASGCRWLLAFFDVPDGTCGINYRCLTDPKVYGILRLNRMGKHEIDILLTKTEDSGNGEKGP